MPTGISFDESYDSQWDRKIAMEDAEDAADKAIDVEKPQGCPEFPTTRSSAPMNLTRWAGCAEKDEAEASEAPVEEPSVAPVAPTDAPSKETDRLNINAVTGIIEAKDLHTTDLSDKLKE